MDFARKTLYCNSAFDDHGFYCLWQDHKMGQCLGCVQVDQSTVAIRETFGKFDDVLEPGCHCLPWCLGSAVAGHLSLRVQQLDVRCETKTKVCFQFLIDKKIVMTFYTQKSTSHTL